MRVENEKKKTETKNLTPIVKYHTHKLHILEQSVQASPLLFPTRGKPCIHIHQRPLNTHNYALRCSRGIWYTPFRQMLEYGKKASCKTKTLRRRYLCRRTSKSVPYTHTKCFKGCIIHNMCTEYIPRSHSCSHNLLKAIQLGGNSHLHPHPQVYDSTHQRLLAAGIIIDKVFECPKYEAVTHIHVFQITITFITSKNIFWGEK